MAEDRIVMEYERGESMLSIARRYRLSVFSVREILQSRGVRIRELSEQMLFRSGGWRKLSRLNNSTTRLVSIPSKLLREAGLDPGKDLVGRWEPAGRRKLVLHVREADAEET